MNTLRIDVRRNHDFNECRNDDQCSMNDDGEIERHGLISGETDLICSSLCSSST